MSFIDKLADRAPVAVRQVGPPVASTGSTSDCSPRGWSRPSPGRPVCRSTSGWRPGIVVVACSPVVMHWSWLARHLPRLRMRPRNQVYRLLDAAMWVLATTVMLSGFVISEAVLPAARRRGRQTTLWMRVHALASMLLLVVLASHLLSHWDWIVTQTQSRSSGGRMSLCSAAWSFLPARSRSARRCGSSPTGSARPPRRRRALAWTSPPWSGWSTPSPTWPRARCSGRAVAGAADVGAPAPRYDDVGRRLTRPCDPRGEPDGRDHLMRTCGEAPRR